MPPFWDLQKVMQAGDRVYAGFKIDLPQFLVWFFQHFDKFVWTSFMKIKTLKLLNNYFSTKFQHIKYVFSQESSMPETNFWRHARKPLFYKKLSKFWYMKPDYIASNTILVDDSE